MKLVLACVCLILPVLAWHDGNHLLRMDRNLKKLIVEPTKERGLLVLGYMDSFVELFEYLIEKMVNLRHSAKEAAEFYINKRPEGPKFAKLPNNVYEKCEEVFEFNNETSLKFHTLVDLTHSLWGKFVKEYRILENTKTNQSEEQIILGPGP